MTMKPFVVVVAAAAIAFMPAAIDDQTAVAQAPTDATKWVASWAASVQGPYPVGNPSAQPDQRSKRGARNQTFRMMVRPDVWGRQARLRFSNAFGTRAVTLDGVYVGLALGGPALVNGLNRTVAFGGKREVTVAPGAHVWSDAVDLAFVRGPGAPELAGRRLAVSFHIAGESGPMTWHAKALT
jgi:hypothetical protein